MHIQTHTHRHVYKLLLKSFICSSYINASVFIKWHKQVHKGIHVRIGRPNTHYINTSENFWFLFFSLNMG